MIMIMIMIMDFDVTHSMQIVILDANSVGLSRHPHIVLTRVLCARALRDIHVQNVIILLFFSVHGRMMRYDKMQDV